MNEQEHTIAGLTHGRVGKALTWFLIIVSIFFVVQTINEVKENKFIGSGAFPDSTIHVTGTGEVFAVPDIAEFTVSVVEGRETVVAAQDTAAEKINQIIAFLKGEGVDEKDIKTASYNLFPRYEFREGAISRFPSPGGERVLVGFEVRQTLRVKVRETGRAGELLSGVGELGASEVSGLSFTIDDEDALKADARERAIKDAKEKAKELADDLDVDLVRVVSFDERGGEGPVYRFNETAAVDGLGGGDLVAPELPTGENKIVSRVDITYEIK